MPPVCCTLIIAALFWSAGILYLYFLSSAPQNSFNYKTPTRVLCRGASNSFEMYSKKKKRDKQTPDSKVAFFVLRVLPELNEYTAAYDRGWILIIQIRVLEFKVCHISC